MLSGIDRVSAMNDLAEFGILRVLYQKLMLFEIFPIATETELFFDTLSCLSFLPKNADPLLAWAILFHDTGKAITAQKMVIAFIFRNTKKHRKNCQKELENFPFRFETDKIAWICREHIPLYGVLNMTRAHRLHLYDHPF